MYANYYKYCIVPTCFNTTIKTPAKLFFYVPQDKQTRTNWLQLANRDTNLSSSSRMYFCEDHFDLPNDMENYIQYQIMGSVSRIRLKPVCLPSKFDCQPGKRKRPYKTSNLPHTRIKQEIECLDESVESSTNSASDSCLIPEVTSNTAPVLLKKEEGVQDLRDTYTQVADKAVQVRITHAYKSKATQANVQSKDQATSPIRSLYKSVGTSPFDVNDSTKSSRPNRSSVSNVSNKIFIEEHCDTNVSSSTASVTLTESSASIHSLRYSELVEEKPKQDAIQLTIKRIMNKPRLYIGVPKNCYFLIDIIIKETNIPLHHLLLCLKKIRLDSKFQELADDFAMSPSNARKIFFHNVPIIASVMRPFIVKLDSQLNEKSLPIAFRHKYHNISCIINCLEIEIQKPSKAVNQALTWSQYKNTHTIKYLISFTPSGLVHYISTGFGGRITDTRLVETCDFVQCLHKGMQVMVDKGFNHVEHYLQKSRIKLIRLPRVRTRDRLTNRKPKQTRNIANLRVHIQKVIKSLQEFDMLKPHACPNMNVVNILDDIVTIASGLINLQSSIK